MSDFSFSALPAANLTGTLPAIDGSSLTGISATVVKVSSDEVTAASSGSGAFQNMGLAASITPASASNKILLIATGTCASNNNTIAFRFTENDVAVALGDPVSIHIEHDGDASPTYKITPRNNYPLVGGGTVGANSQVYFTEAGVAVLSIELFDSNTEEG